MLNQEREIFLLSFYTKFGYVSPLQYGPNSFWALKNSHPPPPLPSSPSQVKNAILFSETNFKDYEPVEYLGAGGFGIVLKCKHKIDKKEYAVKRIQLPTDTEHRNDKSYDPF